jgi:cell division septation protein DedD
VVQFGSTLSEEGAHRHLAALSKESVAAELPRGIERADLGEKGTFYRAWVGAYAEQTSALELCGALKTVGFDCYTRLRPRPRPAEVARSKGAEWVVQIDSEKNIAGARRYAAATQKTHAKLLAELPGGIETVDFKDAGTFHRVWFGRFDSEAEAANLCRALQVSGVSCYARMRAGSVQTAAREDDSENP